MATRTRKPKRTSSLPSLFDLARAAGILNTTTAAIDVLRQTPKRKGSKRAWLTPFKFQGSHFAVCSEREVTELRKHPRIVARAAKAAGR
ncbi:hypothetical protein ANRL3_00948 [Anaerolineae bacterium]|nr:hypothetical protein ANRL3_00948 [Anaerolineae bacterium]